MQRLAIPPETEYGDLRVVREVESPGKRSVSLPLCVWSSSDRPARPSAERAHGECGRCGLEYKGERKTLVAWAAWRGIKESTLRARLKVMGLGEALARR